MSNNIKEVTVTIPFERRMREMTAMLSQCQLLEDFLRSEISSLQSGAVAALKEQQAQKTGEQNGGQ